MNMNGRLNPKQAEFIAKISADLDDWVRETVYEAIWNGLARHDMAYWNVIQDKKKYTKWHEQHMLLAYDAFVDLGFEDFHDVG